MQRLDKTVYYDQSPKPVIGSLVTVFDGEDIPRTIRLNEYGKKVIYFGRDSRNDIVLNSRLVSLEHGRFVYNGHFWTIEDRAAYKGKASTNGLIYNNSLTISHILRDGDFIRIDDGIETVSTGVLFVFSTSDSNNKWSSINLSFRNELSIGRADSCDIHLSHISVSKIHAKIIREKDEWFIVDYASTNGVIINNRRIFGKEKLHEKDVIAITNSKLIFTSSTVFFCCYKNGISVDASDLVVKRGKGKKAIVTTNHVSLNIRPGELIAIIGGSGAGKSTVLNCMCGYLPPTEGEVFVNGVNLYQNFDSLKQIVGYVPQSDIVYDNLTLYDMLLYTAKLRLPKDTTPIEREAAIKKAIDMVELSEKSDSFIKSFSGGQRKRASIAVELLSDPNLLFLDEPASGLDPGTERNLMRTLREMADAGKTVILVTHSTLQLEMCDKIVFMGRGGRLCYFGAYHDALSFFGVSDIVDTYGMITEQAGIWSNKFEKTRFTPEKVRRETTVYKKNKKSSFKQFQVLSERYFKLVVNDKQRLLLLLLQAPLLAGLIAFVADGNQFEQYEMTKSLLFALSCSAFWVGMLNAIQEICKERTILKREYMTGLSLSAYVTSKIWVLGILCLIQSVMITGVFALLVGMPDEGVIVNPIVEIWFTTFITALASAAMGLFVSSLFTNADRAMTVAPILLMPQILFSGLIFKLKGLTELISCGAICRWSMEGYGTTANLNELQLRLQQDGVMIPHEAEDYFSFSGSHILIAWAILLIFILSFMILARIVLSSIKKEKS